MPDPAPVVELIEQAFADVEHPGPAFLQGSVEGCEPGEAVAPFREHARWQDVPAAVLDEHSEALSFLSEGGLRFFLPAFLVADLRGALQRAEPLFHLTHGFEDLVVELPTPRGVHRRRIGRGAFVNPRRYGAMTFEDHARHRLSVFARAEAAAIVAYLEHKRAADTDGFDTARIDAALAAFWCARARDAPEAAALAEHLRAEAAWLGDLGDD